MSLNILNERRIIAEIVERVVGKNKLMSLLDVAKVGKSYPLKPDVPGVWVSGPDAEGRYVVAVSVLVRGLMDIPNAVNIVRAQIWNELAAYGLTDRVRSIDITVEDLEIAA